MSTESVNPLYTDLEIWPAEKAVRAMLDAQIQALSSLQDQVSAMAKAAEAAARRLASGSGSGRIVYAGAGTSGRIAVQDGVELVPTFGWPRERLSFLMAGGMEALARGVEGAEDRADDARAAVTQHEIGAEDVVIGVAASGRTPFTLAVLEQARQAGSLTIALASNAGAPLLEAAEHAILADTGSEVLAGSTRMKAGTAQKACLNILSTMIMLKLGRVCHGLMVDMVISNDKLRRRGIAMVMQLAGCNQPVAARALQQADDNIRLAVMLACGLNEDDAKASLADNGHDLRRALEQLQPGASPVSGKVAP